MQLLAAGYNVVVVDNLCNSSAESLNHVKQIFGKSFSFINADIRDKLGMEVVFKAQQISTVLHFAGLKAVGKSTENHIFTAIIM